MPRTRVAALAASAAVVALLLSGCSVANSVASALRPAVPRVGQCWSGTPQDMIFDSTWTDGAPVACTSRHDSYTFAVEQLQNLNGSWVKPGTADTPRDDIADAASAACFDAEGEFLPGLDDRANLLQFSHFLPAVADWQHGARWVRCDVSLFSIGTTLWEPGFQALPADIRVLVNQIAGKTAELQLCLDTTMVPGPDSDPFADKKATYADCATDPQWAEGNNGSFPEGHSALYPGDDAVVAFENQVCTAGSGDLPGYLWIIYGPTEATWATGARTFECWVAKKTAPQA